MISKSVCCLIRLEIKRDQMTNSDIQIRN